MKERPVLVWGEAALDVRHWILTAVRSLPCWRRCIGSYAESARTAAYLNAPKRTFLGSFLHSAGATHARRVRGSSLGA